jgi:hypothetical protein
MQLNLLSCSAPRPDKRAIAKCLSEISPNIDDSLAAELTDILLQGEVLDIELDANSSNSAMRMLRKLSIDYEIVE